jgi:hypothetical protein
VDHNSGEALLERDGEYTCGIAQTQKASPFSEAFCFHEQTLVAGRRRDHMSFAIVGQVLLFDRWRSQGIIGVTELLGVHARTIQSVRVALGSSGYLNCRPDNQRRGENG